MAHPHAHRYNHQQYQYKDLLQRSVNFILANQQANGDYYIAQGNAGNQVARLYSHAIATLAMCEAYGMTKDQDLAAAAQSAVNYVAFAQIPNDGGWRYTSNDPRGDTSVVGWALMALKSAHMAYLHVDSNTYRGASMFLDSVQVDGGAGYGYTQRQTTPPTAAFWSAIT